MSSMNHEVNNSGGINGVDMSPPPVSPLGSSFVDEDIFNWMFTNPELFPARTFLPGMPNNEELSIPSLPQSVPSSPFREVAANVAAALDTSSSSVKREKDTSHILTGQDDDGSESSNDSSNDNNSKAASSSTTTAVGNDNMKAANNNTRKRAVSAATSASANSVAEGAMTATDDPRQKRLEKNREIARNCRKRKREKMESLEEEVQKLEEWNRQLELKLKQIPENDAKEDIRKREVQEIIALLSNEQHSSEQEIKKKLHQYKEVYSDFGRDRKQAITFHLEQLKSLLLPNQVSKMTIWSLQQEDEFYDEQRNKTTFGGGIWNMLCDELRLTEEQKRTLLSMRQDIRGQRRNVGECLRILKELEKRIHENVSSMGKQMSKVMSSTTPSQQAKFLLWIEQNRSAVQVLNNIWEKKEQRQ